MLIFKKLPFLADEFRGQEPQLCYKFMCPLWMIAFGCSLSLEHLPYSLHLDIVSL